MADLARLTDLFAHEAEAFGFEIVRVKMTGSGEERTLQVMAEDPATGQLIMEQCAQLSRAISARIDEIEEGGEELVEGAYLLEVSSPGIDRPLTRPKDYANWAGYEAKIALSEKIDDHRNLAGELVGIEGDVVTIADKKAGNIAVPLEKIHSAQLVLTDKLIAATQPLDIEGADEIEEFNEEEKADD
ncbi:ribosome maturation protein RimP [Alteraurantiacibacter aquimixticola]|uniref:Ribosome maturation factor RimP n=1 Tax=Alteraurantiacibacter aquimixticola TaxID=2489173 RepID=A0A4T3F501_9SPHN|nr:ribosome maturation protein RimP [Alteraurantiacibacter aquimixticola]TIX51454.1 ribosome maturation protein RimP [Alteraurantiacibacter aquimixticola]